MLLLAKVIEFSNRKNTYNYIGRATLMAIPQKSTLKSIFSYSFWDKCLKLGGYVLGTKFLIEPIFEVKYRILNFASSQFWRFFGDRKFSKFNIFTRSKIGSVKSFVLVPRT